MTKTPQPLLDFPASRFTITAHSTYDERHDYSAGIEFRRSFVLSSAV